MKNYISNTTVIYFITITSTILSSLLSTSDSFIISSSSSTGKFSSTVPSSYHVQSMKPSPNTQLFFFFNKNNNTDKTDKSTNNTTSKTKDTKSKPLTNKTKNNTSTAATTPKTTPARKWYQINPPVDESIDPKDRKPPIVLPYGKPQYNWTTGKEIPLTESTNYKWLVKPKSNTNSNNKSNNGKK